MDHEKLRCYQALLKVAEEAARMVARWPRGSGWLSDQLIRALGSAVLNLVEGNARRQYRTERRRFFDISAASCAEARGALDLAVIRGLMANSHRESLISQLKLCEVQIKALP